MTSRRSRGFLRALREVIDGRPQHWASIASIAARLGIDQEAAEAIAAELDERGLARVGGGHSVTLTEEGRQAVKTRRSLKRAE